MSGLSCPPWASMSADAAASLLVVTGKDPSMSEIGARRLARPSARGRAGAWPLLRSSPPAGLPTVWEGGRYWRHCALAYPRRAERATAPRPFPCPDAGIHTPSPPAFGLLPQRGRIEVGGTTCSRAAQVARAASPWSHRRLAPSCPCPDTGIHAPSPPAFGLLPQRGRIEVGGTTCSRAAQVARAANPWSHRPLAPSCPCPDTGIHAPSPPPFGPLPTAPRQFPCPDTGIHALALRLRASPRRDIRPSPQRPQLPIMPVEACPEPVEGGLPKHPALVPGPPARFTSKCRKMSQNVALFRSPTRKLCNLRVKSLTFLAETWPFWPVSVHFRGSGHS